MGKSQLCWFECLTSIVQFSTWCWKLNHPTFLNFVLCFLTKGTIIIQHLQFSQQDDRTMGQAIESIADMNLHPISMTHIWWHVIHKEGSTNDIGWQHCFDYICCMLWWMHCYPYYSRSLIPFWAYFHSRHNINMENFSFQDWQTLSPFE